MPRKDFSQIAFDVVQQTTYDPDAARVPTPGRKLSAAALAARAKGGKARAAALSDVEKKSIAAQGAASRWKPNPVTQPQPTVTEAEANPQPMPKAKRRIVF
jgi:hypothetical protein